MTFKTTFDSKLLTKFETSLQHGPNPASDRHIGKILMPLWMPDFV